MPDVGRGCLGDWGECKAGTRGGRAWWITLRDMIFGLPLGRAAERRTVRELEAMADMLTRVSLE